MQYKSLYDFFWFGTCLRYLQDVQEGFFVHGESFVLENLRQFFMHVKQLGLNVTERHAHSQLDSLYEELLQYENDAEISAEKANQLREAMNKIRETLEAEIQGVGAYMPNPKRFDLSSLLENVESLFSPDTFQNLPEIGRRKGQTDYWKTISISYIETNCDQGGWHVPTAAFLEE